MIDEKNELDNGNDGVGQAFLLFAICLGLLLFVGVFLQLISFEIGLIITLVGLILCPAIFYVSYWHKLPLARGLRICRVKPHTVVLSILLGAGGWSLAATVYFLQIPFLGPELESGISIDSTKTYFFMIFAAAVLPGICEEVLFRGVILGILQRKGDGFAIVVSACLFGVFHIDPWRILPAAFLGIVLGWLVVRTGSLIPSILAHVANNATAISVSYFYSGSETSASWLMIGLGFLFVVSFVGILLTVPKTKARPELERVRAGIPKWMAWGMGFVGAMTTLCYIGSVVLFLMFIRIIEVNDNALQPNIRTGDKLVLLTVSNTNKLKPAETIGIKRDGKTLGRVVARAEQGRVWIWEGTSEMEVDVDSIVGKMLQIIPSTEGRPEELNDPSEGVENNDGKNNDGKLKGTGTGE